VEFLGLGLMVRIKQTADDGFADAEEAGEGSVREVAFPDGDVESELARDPKGNRLLVLASFGSGGLRDIGAGSDAFGDNAAQAIDRFFGGFGEVFAVSVGAGEVGEADKKAAGLVALEAGGVFE